MTKIKVLESNIAVVKDDYISLTDIAKHKDSQEANEIIINWLRNRNTIEFLGTWEKIYNDDFKPVEFEGFRKEAGLTQVHHSKTKKAQPKGFTPTKKNLPVPHLPNYI